MSEFDTLMEMALPIVYAEWCVANNTNPLMHDPLCPEFAVLTAERVQQQLKALSADRRAT